MQHGSQWLGRTPVLQSSYPCDPSLDSGLAQNLDMSAQPRVLRLLSDSACLDYNR